MAAIRQVKDLNTIVEQDHRAVKRVTRPMLGFKSFALAQRTIVGIELRHMLHKGQMEDGADQGLPAAEQFYALASSSPPRQELLTRNDLLRKICDTTIIAPLLNALLWSSLFSA